MVTINRANLRASHQLPWFLLDLLMLGLLLLNLALLVFDSVYSFIAVQNLLAQHAPVITQYYQPVHENFIFYDLLFVTVFLAEFLLRWGYAVKSNSYARWYFYPFIHWYDLVGCIPVGSLRFLRILRVISILYRLHKYNIIDVTRNRLFQFANFYYEAFMEELSDKIALKILSGIQLEISRGAPLLDRVKNDILYPRRDLLTGWLSNRIAETAQQGYVPNRGALTRYIESRVDIALQDNLEISRLRYVPVVGGTIKDTLEDAIGDIVARVIHQILDDLATSSNHGFIEDIVQVLLPEPGNPDDQHATNEALIALINEIIEAVKAQIRIKHWRAEL
ncbi:hypothetical protein [Marinobacter sp. X15-166B]|uniref:hypothetical protein n=1 Tax=Marinobacter sp. X15-166B TaxID=1897620 RepID=UPI00085C362B|nr:hypothetical protein [Marinobacter sp. X15-166B]OEY67054.1 hypothetical protein BG841_11700 [Marinobacter sp. X15-166B]